MESIETLIPDNEGNHLVVVLYFYDDKDKSDTFQIPDGFSDLDIADISIRKLNLDRPLALGALYRMCSWLLGQLKLFPNAVFSFLCSLDPLETHHNDLPPEQYRWLLFERLCQRYQLQLENAGINTQKLIVGPEGFQTYAKVFYRDRHSSIIHLVVSHLTNKYS